MTHHRLRHLPRTLAGALTILAMTALAACGSDDSAPAAAKNATPTAGATAAVPKTLTIAYQAIPNGDLVVKHAGWLEQALPDTKIEWKLFDSGGSVNEAVAARSIDIGLAGSSPVSRGISQPLPYQVPWIHDVIGKAEALVVKPGITSIADLKGKKIATPLASTAHYSLLAALKDNGLTDKDVKIIDAEPDDIFAAYSRGDIDGAYVWNPTLAKIVKNGGKLLITSADLAKEGKTTYDLAVVTNDFASKYPAALKTWAQAQDRAVKLYRNDKATYGQALAAELNIGADEALAQAGDLIFLDASQQAGADYLGGGLGRNLFAAATFNKELGQIDVVQPEAAYTRASNPRFAAAVGKG
ncbi:MAG: aliphatic sulfonates family transporter, periplasmic ligand-binding protein [Solirubrobacterales bacterium]|nr:aliphatic sulfonates family transporter, periplasmic ligand-binding protein [Solirubrobacterales bacterium]